MARHVAYCKQRYLHIHEIVYKFCESERMSANSRCIRVALRDYPEGFVLVYSERFIYSDDPCYVERHSSFSLQLFGYAIVVSFHYCCGKRSAQITVKIPAKDAFNEGRQRNAFLPST